MNIQTVTQNFKLFASMTGLKAKKYSPEILMVGGITGMIGATILACQATLKSQSILADHKTMLETTENALAVAGKDNYTDEDRRKDLAIIYARTTKNLAKEYAPAFTLAIASIVCILGGQNILKKRNVVLVAAYKLVEQGWADYRARVVDELGPTKDLHFLYGTEEKTIESVVVGEDGKKVKTKKVVQALVPGTNYSVYARLFEKQVFEHGGTWSGSSQFCPIHSYNHAYISGKIQWLNDRLNGEGFLFLNDAYEELGFPRTAVGQQVGWVKGNGDGFISCGLAMEDMFAYQDGDGILLDFNVDGFVLDLIP